jgi:hypothetical protein
MSILDQPLKAFEHEFPVENYHVGGAGHKHTTHSALGRDRRSPML